MIDRLRGIEERYETLRALLEAPENASDFERCKELMRELRQLEPVVKKLRDLRDLEREEEGLRGIAEDKETEAELSELARSELAQTAEKKEAVSKELKLLLLPRDPNDDRNVILELRSGAGGEEAALFAGSLLRMYTMYAERRGFRTEILNENLTELGGVKELSLEIFGEGAYSRFKFESGVHRVQRVPETESQGRIQTSTVTVAVMPEADEVELHIDPAELQIDAFRSSGAGGQKVNKTSSAIRVTHLPTGTVVECQDERSQFKNKDRALKILRSRLFEAEQEKQREKIAGERRAQVGSGDRSERIRTYNFPQGRVSDHRINLTLYKLESILDGDLDELIDALITADTARKLQDGEDTREGQNAYKALK